MKALVVGGGGRENAIAAALHRSGTEVYSIMKNNNPGIAKLSVETELMPETDTERVAQFATSHGIDLAVIGPEAPLEAGLVDVLEDEGIGCVGPTKAAARLETSKSFARTIMRRHKVPGNLDFAAFNEFSRAKAYIKDSNKDLVIKPIGLTGGKGVKVMGEHLKTKKEALAYIEEIFSKNIGGAGVILEEKAIGEEFTLQAFCDGRSVVPMPLVQDHKRAYDGDVGPNTGGMGSYTLEDHRMPFVRNEDYEAALDIVKKTVAAMRAEGCPYKGILYGQFMLTADGPRVIEFNARFCDPEAMNVLSVLSSSFTDICSGIASGRLNAERVSFANKATVCKYVVPEGYGTEPKAGLEISIDEEAIAREGAMVYYAMVDKKGDKIFTTTSRAAGVVGIADTLEEAEENCEHALKHVQGSALFVRHDIGKAELVQKRIDHMQQIRG